MVTESTAADGGRRAKKRVMRPIEMEGLRRTEGLCVIITVANASRFTHTESAAKAIINVARYKERFHQQG